MIQSELVHSSFLPKGTGQAQSSAPTGRASSRCVQPLLLSLLTQRTTLSHSTSIPTPTPSLLWSSRLQSPQSLLIPKKLCSFCLSTFPLTAHSSILENGDNSVIINGRAILFLSILILILSFLKESLPVPTNYHQGFLLPFLQNTALCQSNFVSKENTGD